MAMDKVMQETVTRLAENPATIDSGMYASLKGTETMRLSWKLKAMTLTAGLLLSLGLAPLASAATRHVVIVERFPFFYGGYYPFYPYPGYAPTEGYVKIETDDKATKETKVYVDGGYAGTVGQLKKFPLRPGNHKIELRNSDGRALYQEDVQIILGKTAKIRVG